VARGDAASRRAERELARCDALEAAGQALAGSRSAPRGLIQATRDRGWLVRVVAIEALQDIGDRRSFAALRACVRDPNPIVRSYAAVAAAVVDPARARPLIRRLAAAERSSQARVGHAEALFRLGDRAALATLLRLVKSSPYRVRCAVANTLADMELTAIERAEAVRAVEAALAVESTVAARSRLETARRALKGPARR
jgi:HEAT repeat protein